MINSKSKFLMFCDHLEQLKLKFMASDLASRQIPLNSKLTFDEDTNNLLNQQVKYLLHQNLTFGDKEKPIRVEQSDKPHQKQDLNSL